MKRIILMVLRNLLFAPYWYWQLWYYGKHSQDLPDEKKFALLRKIVRNANKGGNVTIDAHGMENVPKEDSFMYFPNHQGMYDVLAMIDCSPRFFSVVVKKELINMFFLKHVFRVMGAYAIDREDVRQSMKVIQNVTKDVKDGHNYLIFAEGTRSRKGNKIGEFKGGSFKSAVKAGCPIVPVAIIDSYKAFDTDSVKPVTVQVHYLEPLYYDEYKMMKTTEIAEVVSERIRKRIEKFEKNN